LSVPLTDPKQRWERFYSLLNKCASKAMMENHDMTIDYKHERAYMVKWDSKSKRYRRLTKAECTEYYEELFGTYDLSGKKTAPYTPKQEFDRLNQVISADEAMIFFVILQNVVRNSDYEVMMSFYSPTYSIGSLDVKFGDKWYAFGETSQPIRDEEEEDDIESEESAREIPTIRPESYDDYEISTIWPLVRARANSFETKPEYQVPIPDYDLGFPGAISRVHRRRARPKKEEGRKTKDTTRS